MAAGYTWQQWLLFFYIYSFFGWIFESTYVSLKSRQITNRGFLRGPFIPIYGSGAVMMLYASQPFQDNLVLTYISGLIGATTLELLVGMALETIFKVKYWDYSYQKFNYKGHICLSSSIAWGFFTVIMDRWLHPGVLMGLTYVPYTVILVGMPLVTIILFYDTCTSVKEALDLRDALVRIEQMRTEVVHLRKRADVIIAVLDDDFEQFIKAHPSAERVEEVFRSVEHRFDLYKERVKLMDEKVREKYEGEFKELREMKLHFDELKKRRIVNRNDMIRKFESRILNNPSMKSEHYGEALDFLKEAMENRRTKENETWKKTKHVGKQP